MSTDQHPYLSYKKQATLYLFISIVVAAGNTLIIYLTLRENWDYLLRNNFSYYNNHYRIFILLLLGMLGYLYWVCRKGYLIYATYKRHHHESDFEEKWWAALYRFSWNFLMGILLSILLFIFVITFA